MARSRNRSVFAAPSGPSPGRRIAQGLGLLIVLGLFGALAYAVFGNYAPSSQTVEILIPNDRFLRH